MSFKFEFMKSCYKKLLLCLGFGFLIFGFSANAYTSPGNPQGYVNDFAQIIPDDNQQNLELKLEKFESETSNEISIVTVNSLDGDIIENFAIDLFEEWKIGKDSIDNGILLLVAVDDREMRIEVGYGLEGALTDIQSYSIIDTILKPAFKQEDYYNGINQAADSIMAATKGEYTPVEKKKTSKGVNIGKIFWLIIALAMWLASVLGRSKSWWLGGVIGLCAGLVILLFKGLLIGISSAIILSIIGLIFDFVVSKEFQKTGGKDKVPWWAGGGHGGGSGFGGGGGFGGFSGGSSGGGGSSGSW